MKDYEECFEKHWRDIICPGITGMCVDMDQMKKELFDYWNMMAEVTKVYHYITGGTVSYPNTKASVVIAEADEHYQKYFEGESDE